jgi:alpha-mannosidase
MEDFHKYDQRRHQRQARWLGELRSWRNALVQPVPNWTFTGADGVSHPITIGQPWPSVDTPVTLTATATIPESWAGNPVELELWLGGEGLVKLTPGHQEGLNPFHHDFKVTDSATGGETITIEAEVVPKGMFGSHVHGPSFDRAHLTIPHPTVRALETDLKMLVQAAEQLQDHEIFSHLIDLVDDAYRELAPVWPTSTDIARVRYISGDSAGGAHHNLGLGDYSRPGFERTLVLSGIWHIPPPAGSFTPLSDEAIAATESARRVIATGLDRLKTQYPPVGNILLSGHAHIDLAWLWPVAETRRKVRRTFSSVLHLMDQYDDFTFNQSSAQAYAWIAEDDPEIFARIKERVAEGRWDVVGGMWLEPDSQVTGAESYVRHIFYGQRFFQKHFNLRNNAAWLPDVFGFSAGIPQILHDGGIDRFFTIKVNWSEVNPFPFDIYWWQGIDGTRVLAHHFDNPGEGYNGNITPLDTLGTWKNFKGKRVHDQTLLSFGWGDGGGGPSDEMLQNYARIKDYPVLPRLEMGKVEDFFDDLPTEGIPTYVGELYLELHRGTLTTQGLVKKLNRESEHLLAEAEAFSSLASLNGADYPHQAIDAAWETVLLNHFHDILPGSSVHEVYEDTHRELNDVVANITTLRNDTIAALAGDGAVPLVANPSLHPRSLTAILPEGTALPENMGQAVEGGTLIHDPATIIGGLSLGTLPESATPLDPVTVSGDSGSGITLENGLIRYVIGSDGTVAEAWDKNADRGFLSDRANQLWAYVDRPRAWDAWDIDETYENAGSEITDLDSVEVIEEGPLRASIRVTRTWRDSIFIQTYRLLAGSKQLDIETDIDWHERMMLVRAQFPTSIHTHEAVGETIYGVQRRATHRNTQFERARFEVGAHRLLDLSEPDYGVALLNNGKYGHSVLGGTIGLSLVRGPLYPDPFADEGEHHFAYAIYPHNGDWVTGGVVRAAQEFNAPLIATTGSTESVTTSLVEVTGLELGFSALKKAHDRDGLVLRLYEPHGSSGKSTLTFNRPLKSATRVTLMEENHTESTATVSDNTVTLNLRPFELVSLLLEF